MEGLRQVAGIRKSEGLDISSSAIMTYVNGTFFSEDDVQNLTQLLFVRCVRRVDFSNEIRKPYFQREPRREHTTRRACETPKCGQATLGRPLYDIDCACSGVLPFSRNIETSYFSFSMRRKAALRFRRSPHTPRAREPPPKLLRTPLPLSVCDRPSWHIPILRRISRLLSRLFLTSSSCR